MTGTFLFLVILVAVISPLNAHVCPVQNATDTPQFTKKLGSEDWVRYGTEIALWCCAEGYDAIKWYRRVDGTSGWESYPPASTGDSDAPEVQEDGQILRIYKPKLQDEATYRCDLEEQSKVRLSHETKLNVVECDPVARGPLAIAPSPHNITIYEYGGNLSIDCTGYFGCQDTYIPVLEVVQWRVAGKYNQDIENLSNRYKVNTTIADKNTVKKATLTITDVQEVDTEQTFVCQLASPQADYHQTNIPVKITKQEKPKFPWMLVAGPVGGFVVFIILILITYKVVSYRWGPRISLYVNSRLGRGPKTISAEEYKYNLFIYHADADQDIAEELKNHLKENGYEVFISADIPADQLVMNKFFEKAAESALVYFLYSENLVEEELADFLLQSVIAERNGKGIEFLELAKYTPEEVMDWALQAKDPRAGTVDAPGEDANKVVNGEVNEHVRNERVEISIEEGDGTTETGTLEAKQNENETKRKDSDAEPEKNDQKKINDLKFWKVLPHTKVPSRQSWKWTNFLCTLQNRIPKFQDQKQIQNDQQNVHKRTERKLKRQQERNSSSSKPLLASPPTSPNDIDNNEVFDYKVNEENDNITAHAQRNAFSGSENSMRKSKNEEGKDGLQAETPLLEPNTANNKIHVDVHHRDAGTGNDMINNENAVFTSSTEGQNSNIGSFGGSESGYSDGEYSARGAAFSSSSEHCQSLSPEIRSNQSSSGISDFRSGSPFQNFSPDHTSDYLQPKNNNTLGIGKTQNATMHEHCEQ